MNGIWNQQQQDIRAHYLAVGRQLVRPTSAQRDQELGFDRELWRALGSSGLFGVHMPKQYGGQGLGIWEFSAALEGFSEGCQDMGVLVSFVAQVALVQAALISYGSEEQLQRWLPPLISGEKIGCFAITEQGCGSDVRSLKLAARRDGSGYRLNGMKWNITNAPVADICMTFARLDEAGANAISCFITETAKPGLVQSAPFELMGNRGTPIGSLSFDEVALDADSLVGTEGQGLRVLYFGFLVERIFTGVSIVGCMQPVIDECMQYSLKREAFGRPISDNQYVQGHIVQAYTQLELLRSVVGRGLTELEHGRDCSTLASIIKMLASEAMHEACLNAMRIHGNYGYRRDFHFERLLRDSIGLFFAGGTSEIHKTVIWANLVAEAQNRSKAKDDLRLDAYTGEGAAA
ncbi:MULTISPECIES: acyl-CoA dehydrogenase family protein [unclassified Pseudomonas]|uniref:acyl-CoA dehydrogenase family protein n=1 Tax=unclassified Pseudomonas TaxID=196821 RepID=UPI0014850044|nr:MULTISPECIES: acyl-CoA dehydrogenase family protein [unclassified Pseudomonas]WJN60221.1 Acyl-CoA dehydrogenase [Pseudomonas sp. SO81]